MKKNLDIDIKVGQTRFYTACEEEGWAVYVITSGYGHAFRVSRYYKYQACAYNRMIRYAEKGAVV